MMEHIDDDEYFQQKLDSAKKRKEIDVAGTVDDDDANAKKKRSVEDYCDVNYDGLDDVKSSQVAR